MLLFRRKKLSRTILRIRLHTEKHLRGIHFFLRHQALDQFRRFAYTNKKHPFRHRIQGARVSHLLFMKNPLQYPKYIKARHTGFFIDIDDSVHVLLALSNDCSRVQLFSKFGKQLRKNRLHIAFQTATGRHFVSASSKVRCHL